MTQLNNVGDTETKGGGTVSRCLCVVVCKQSLETAKVSSILISGALYSKILGMRKRLLNNLFFYFFLRRSPCSHTIMQCLLIYASVHGGRARLYRLETDTVTVTAVFPF